ncbi:MAG: SHOCT domain-containing protein [Acidobacteria bacterium]|nr:SHOCT domain-containing protein [Acidobacteriota bacterium]
MKAVGALKAASLLVWLGVILGASLFIGLMIASAGGAVYTPLYRAAAPFACDGEFSVESRRYSYKPGQSGVEHRIYCRDKTTGARADITFYAIFIAFLVYSGLTFAALLAVSLVLVFPLRALARRAKTAVGPVNLPAVIAGTPRAPRKPARIVVNGREYSGPEDMPAETRAAYEGALGVFADSDGDNVPDLFEGLGAKAQPPAEDAAARLKRLKSLSDAGLITEQEYQAKRAEILSGL